MKSWEIKSGNTHNLLATEDTGCENEAIFVLTFTPNMKDTSSHWHIDLSIDEAEILRWALNEFFGSSRRE